MTKDLRLELRTRNNILWHAIFDTHKTVAAFCRTCGLTQTVVGKLLNLSASPYLTCTSRHGKAGDPRPAALLLAAATGRLVEDLFPRALYTGLIPLRMSAEIPSHLYRGLGAAKHLALPAGQEDLVVAREAREAIDFALSTLTPREAIVIRARFGLDGGQEQLVETIASRLGVSKVRVRQIHAKALRKMRHPLRSRALRPYLP